MAYDNEKVGKAILAHLKTDLATRLVTVAAYWTAQSDPVTLPAVVTWFEGYKPTLLEQAVTAFPFVEVLVPVREPGEDRSAWKYQSQTLHAFVDLAVSAADELTVNKIAHRYAEAICLSLKQAATFGGYTQVNYEPPVNLVSFTRHLKSQDNADAFNADDVYYLIVKSIAVDLQGG